MTELVIFCNPLLDISVDVDDAFLTQYQLKPGNAVLADPAIHGDAFYQMLSTHPSAQFIAGGSAMNTARVCAWMLDEKAKKDGTPRVAYIGSVGDDEHGHSLRSSASKSNVDVGGMYLVPKDHPTFSDAQKATGLCGVCIVGKERSLVARLGAADSFPMTHVESGDVAQRVHCAAIVYVSGYFLTVCAEGALRFAAQCTKEGKTFALNLSAPFILQVPPFQAAVRSLLPHCSLLFGNETEAAALAEMLGWKTSAETMSVKEIATRLVREPGLLSAGACVCFTMGSDSTVLAHGETVQEVPVLTVENIVDTNGAGDSFVGGFLAARLLGKDVVASVQAGHYAAGVVIQHSGCAYPAHPSYTY